MKWIKLSALGQGQPNVPPRQAQRSKSLYSVPYLCLHKCGVLYVQKRGYTGCFSVSGLSFNPLKTKRRLLYLKTHSYRAVNTFHLGYKNQSVYAVSGTSRCLLSDKYKIHKYSVGRAYSSWMLNCWCITWPVGLKRLTNFMQQSHWESNRFSVSQEIPRILWNPQVHYRWFPNPIPLISV